MNKLLVICERYNPNREDCKNCDHGRLHNYCQWCYGHCTDDNDNEVVVDCKIEEFIKENDFKA